MSSSNEIKRSSSFACSWRARQLLASYSGEILPGFRVLDVGCGNGAIGRAIAESFRATVEGADVVSLLTHDMPFHKLPEAWEQWTTRPFDVVMINDALHHMSPAEQLSTLRHASAVGRKLLIFDTCPTMLAKIADVVMARIVYRGREAVPLTHREPYVWMQILAELGFRAAMLGVDKFPFFYPLRHFAIVAEPSSIEPGI